MALSKEFEASPMSGHQEAIEVEAMAAKHMGEGDEETNRYIGDTPIEIDAATNKRIFWKINRRILVIQLVTYFCQSLDKGTLNFSSTMGIQKDAHLVGQQVRVLGL
jgi:hypothetical protein